MSNDLSNVSLGGSAFDTDQNATEYSPDYISTLCNTFYPTIMVIGVLGNFMVILVIIKTKAMLNSTNIFLANLAAADILVLLVWGTEAVVDANSERGLLAIDDILCNVLSVAMEAVTNVSVLTILAISLERYYAICRPLKAGYICTKSRAYKICLLTWPVAAMLSGPHFFIKYTAIEYTDGIYSEMVCQDVTESFWMQAYFFTCATVFYFLPLVFLIALYSVISRHLKGHAPPGTNLAALQHRSHVIKILALIIFCFFLCHLPFRVFYLWYVFEPDLIERIGVQGYKNAWIITESMINVNSALNPILYSFVSKRFSDRAKSIFCGKICGLKEKNVHQGRSTSTTQVSSNSRQ